MLTVCAAAAAWSCPANARGAFDAIRAWNLTGTWAPDCRRPPTRDNVWWSFTADEDGRVYYQRNFGDSMDRNEMIRGGVTAEGHFDVIVNFAALGQVREWVLIKAADGRLKAIVNLRVNTDNYSIRDGVFTATGLPVPWQTRCSGPPIS